MKRKISAVLLLLGIPVLLGMGSLQGPATPEKIPIPVKKYFAVYVDQADVITECSEVSIEGATFLEGKRGEGTYTISFDNIEHVSFRVTEEQLIGLVKLRDGGTSELFLNMTRRAYGQTKYGTFQIKMADLKKLVIRTAANR